MMDLSRMSGPFVHHSLNKDHDQNLNHDTASTSVHSVTDIYESTCSADRPGNNEYAVSTDENFVAIAERLLGRYGYVSLQQFNEELKNTENHYLQLQVISVDNKKNDPNEISDQRFGDNSYIQNSYCRGNKSQATHTIVASCSKSETTDPGDKTYNTVNSGKVQIQEGHLKISGDQPRTESDLDIKEEIFEKSDKIENAYNQVQVELKTFHKDMNEEIFENGKQMENAFVHEEGNLTTCNRYIVGDSLKKEKHHAYIPEQGKLNTCAENVNEKNFEKEKQIEDDYNLEQSKLNTSHENVERDNNHELNEQNCSQETRKEFEKKVQESISIRFDKESQTFMCVKREKIDKLMCKADADQPDSCAASRELPYKCKFCDEAFSLFTQLKRHTINHSKESLFTCQTCGRVCLNEAELLKHTEKHDRAKPHICVECGKGFRQLHMLQNHIRTHSGEKPFLCETCGQGFGQKENLKLHERTHTGFKPYKCAICGKNFNNTKCLHRHELTHSGERNYRCDTCGKNFLRNDHLRRHKRSHGEEPRFKCSYCGKGFHQKVNLVEHERIHTGDKPFVCEICEKSFTQRGNLKAHFIKHSFV